MTGATLLLINLITLPGTLEQFLHQMPKNIHFVQVERVYLWERHATFKAFWRLLLQGTTVGEMTNLAAGLTALSMAGVAVMLIRVSPVGSGSIRWDERRCLPARPPGIG